MRTIGNILWFVLGGFLMGLAWWIFGLLAFISIIGIPWGRACFVIGTFTFLPFGRETISRSELTGQQDLGTGPLGLLGNIIWFLLAGIWLATGHILIAIPQAISIIGIPFAWQHIKLAAASLAPVGKTVVSCEVAEAARMANARDEIESLRAGR
jgi:uncharacterized membrane protein YccF (DUF307 family)